MSFIDKILGNATQVQPEEVQEKVAHILIPGERVISAFKLIRDMMVFTEQRLIWINVQGITGSKKSFDSILYKSITRFSIETAGTFDLDSELKIWISGNPLPVSMNFKKGSDLSSIQRLLAHCVFGSTIKP